MANVIFNENTGVEVPDTLTVRTDIENGLRTASSPRFKLTLIYPYLIPIRLLLWGRSLT